ncbi:hypothetical protein QC763_000085 [Podospora pseudopauciseta]|uniref:Fucose-specific lectin n=1 Tax=Podospora pseudopauciseta TaxID=2093780 RepID=A0ABR0H5S6_9PEZI|nr:hypothetical protein QC763_000085 [Podospora pseudopauciseta]
MMAMALPNLQYSDLPEAVHRQHDFPEVVAEDAPQAVERRGETAKYLAYANVQNLESSIDTTSAKEPPERRILGLKRKTIFILSIIGAVILIGAIVGIALGVTISQRKSPSSQEINIDDSLSPNATDNSPPAPPPSQPSINLTALPSNISPLSSLASANYTDPKTSIVHLHVYSQLPPPSNSLLVSIWNSTARIWTTYSLSALLPSTYDLLPGTPISAYVYTNPAFQAGVMVLTTDHVLHQFVTSDVTMKNWRHGGVGQGDAILTVGKENKNFQVLRPQCGTGEDCKWFFPPSAVGYQDGEGTVRVFNMKVMRGFEVGKGREGTELGLVSLVRAGGEGGFNVSDIYWRVVFVPEGGRELKGWTAGKEMVGESDSLGDMPSTPASHNMAAFSYDLVNQMIVTLEDGGRRLGVRTLDGLAGNKWTLAREEDDPAGLGDQKGEVRFTAITGTPEKRVFGMVNGNIHEWRFSSGRPRSWEYVGRVSTSPVLTG